MKKLIVYIIAVVIIVVIIIPPTIKIINKKIYHLRLKHKQAAKKLAEESFLMQNLRALTKEFNRELGQVIINNNLPNGKKVYFEIKQLSCGNSILRFGCNIDSGLVEIGYQIKPSYKRWNDYDLWKLKLNKNMWNYSEPNWPAINFNSEYVEPFAFGIVGFQVKYWDDKKNKWIAGDWDSIDQNSIPRKILIVLKTLTETKGKEAVDITNLYNVKGIHIQKIEINLPRSR